MAQASSLRMQQHTRYNGHSTKALLLVGGCVGQLLLHRHTCAPSCTATTISMAEILRKASHVASEAADESSSYEALSCRARRLAAIVASSFPYLQGKLLQSAAVSKGCSWSIANRFSFNILCSYQVSEAAQVTCRNLPAKATIDHCRRECAKCHNAIQPAPHTLPSAPKAQPSLHVN